MNDKEIQVIDFAYLRMCAEHDYIYETGEAKLLLNYITNLQQENERLKDKIEKATNFVDKYMDEWDFQDEVWKDMNDLLILLKEN